MPAEAPKRSSGSATLSYGPLTIPIQLFSGVEDIHSRFVKRSEYTRDGEPVGRAPIIQGSEPPQLVEGDVLRCVETEHGLVELTNEEIDSVLNLPEKQAEIVTFIPLHVMGAGYYMPETLMQVRPAKGKQRGTYDPAAAKAFTTLMKAMRQEQVFALTKLNLRGRPAYGALLPTGRLYRLLFDDEVREDLPLPDFEVSASDVALVREIIEVSSKPPTLSNEHRHLILGYVEKKGKEGQTIDQEPVPVEASDDLLAELRAAVRKDAE